MQGRTTMAVAVLLATAGSVVHGQTAPPYAGTVPAGALDGRPVREIRLPVELRPASVESAARQRAFAPLRASVCCCSSV